MARIPAGTRVETQISVTSATQRDYAFSFPVGRAEDVSVSHNGVLVDPARYEISLAPDRRTGTVRFYDHTELSYYLPLAVRDQLTIQRDTEVRRRTSFGTGGFAGAASVEAMAAYVNRVLEELASRVETHATVVLNRSEITDIVRDQITAAQSGGGGLIEVGLDTLTAALRTLVNRFALADQVTLSGTTLTFYTAEGAQHDVELADLEVGVSVENDGQLIGIYRAIHTLNATGGASWSVSGETATLHVAAAPAGGSPGMGGSTTETHELNPLDLMVTPLATATDIVASSAGVWTGWTTLFTSPAISADDAGVVSVAAVLRGELTVPTVASGGGDRVYVESRIVRTRAANDVAMDWDLVYVRNGGPVGGWASAAFQEATQKLEKSYSIWDDAEEGDTYKVEARVIAQVAGRTMQFSTDSMMEVVTGANVASITTTDTTGGGGGGSMRTDAQIDALIDANEKVLRGEALDRTLRTPIDLARNVMVQQAATPASYRIGAAGTKIPTDTGDYEFEIKGRAPDPRVRFNLSDLTGLPAVADSAALDDTNSLKWSPESGVTLRVGHSDAHGQDEFVFEGDSIGAYRITIRGFPILLEAGMLPSASLTASGIISSNDYQRLQNAITTAFFDTPSPLTNRAVDATADRLLVSVGGNTAGDRMRGMSFSELDARYAAAGQAGRGSGNAVVLDTSGFGSGDAGSFPGWDGGTPGAFEEASFADSDIEWTYAGGEWTAKGFRSIAALPTGTLLANLPTGTLRFLEGHGVYEVKPETGATATATVVGWTPARETGTDNYGWAKEVTAPFGSVPPGLVAGNTGVVPVVPGLLALFRDRDNRVWLRATEGYFSRAGMVVQIRGGSAWHLGYNETTDGVDEFFSGTSIAPPWATTSVDFSIHALGGVEPFLAAGAKHWVLVSPIPRSLPAWLTQDTPRPPEDVRVLAQLPEPMVPRRRYRTTAESILQTAYDVTPARAGTNIIAQATFTVPAGEIREGAVDGDGNPDPDFGEAGGLWTLTRYANVADPGIQPWQRGQLIVLQPAGGNVNLLRVVINGSGHDVTRRASPNQRSFVVTNPPTFDAGEDYRVVLIFSIVPEEHRPPATRVEAGDWTARTEYTVEATPGAPAEWAFPGNPKPVPPGKLPHFSGREVLEHSFRFSITNVATDARISAPFKIGTTGSTTDPTLDLDASNNQRGDLRCSAFLRISPPSGGTLGISWVSGRASPNDEDRTITLSADVHLSQLRAPNPAYVATRTGAPTGAITWLEREAFVDTTSYGTFNIALVRNDQNEVEVFWWWDGGSVSAQPQHQAVVTGTIWIDRSTADIGTGETFLGLPDVIPSALPAAGVREDLVLADNGVITQRPGPEGRKIATWTVRPASPATAGIETATTIWPRAVPVEGGFGPLGYSDNARGGILNVPKSLARQPRACGWILVGKVAGVEVSRSYIPSLMLLTGPRAYLEVNAQTRLGVVVSTDSTRRLVVLEYRRELSNRQDVIQIFAAGTGNNVYEADTTVELLEWVI